MTFREVGVHEVREVLRLWLRGEGLRSIERLAVVGRKTVRRYLCAAREVGLTDDGGEAQLDDWRGTGSPDRDPTGTLVGTWRRFDAWHTEEVLTAIP